MQALSKPLSSAKITFYSCCDSLSLISFLHLFASVLYVIRYQNRKTSLSASSSVFMDMVAVEARLQDRLAPVVEAPPTVPREPSRSYSHRSIETLVVVLAVITIVGVIAGIIARLCGGRHFGGNGENDIEGWIENKCRSCIDGGIPAAAVPPPPPQESKPAATEEEKK